MKRRTALLTVGCVLSFFVDSHVFSHTPCTSEKNARDSAEAWRKSAADAVKSLESKIFQFWWRLT